MFSVFGGIFVKSEQFIPLKHRIIRQDNLQDFQINLAKISEIVYDRNNAPDGADKLGG